MPERHSLQFRQLTTLGNYLKDMVTFQCPSGIHFNSDLARFNVTGPRRHSFNARAAFTSIPTAVLETPWQTVQLFQCPSGIHFNSDDGNGRHARGRSGFGVSMPERHSLQFRLGPSMSPALSCDPVSMPERHSLQFRRSIVSGCADRAYPFQCPSGIHFNSDAGCYIS